MPRRAEPRLVGGRASDDPQRGVPYRGRMSRGGWKIGVCVLVAAIGLFAIVQSDSAAQAKQALESAASVGSPASSRIS